MIRQVIKIRAEDSPNVRLAFAEMGVSSWQEYQELSEAGALRRRPSGTVLVPGVLSWEDYRKRRLTWDVARQKIGLDAEFPDETAMLLFPEEWLRHSKEKAAELERGRQKRVAKAVGVDPAEGGDRTAWCVVDEHGVLDLISKRTPDTTVIVRDTVDLMRRWNVPGEKVVFDRACGKAHADRLRQMGHPVQTVHFGESIMLDLRRGLIRIEERRENREEKSIYQNRRVEMYHDLSALCNPASERGGFGIPERFAALFKQLAPIPHLYDKESGDGKLILPDKAEMIRTLYNNEGSPDEADALALAVFGMTHKVRRPSAGVVS